MFSMQCYAVVFLISCIVRGEHRSDFLSKRTKILEVEEVMKIGGKLDLSPAEQKVNDTLMATKVKEIMKARLQNDSVPPGQHFFKAKTAIDRSEVFQFIKRVPKGKTRHQYSFRWSVLFSCIVDLKMKL